MSDTHKDITLIQTCESHPEQYDALFWIDTIGHLVGYLRLRHGCFTVNFPDVSGEEIYSAYPDGDSAFEDKEREYYLDEARKAIWGKVVESGMLIPEKTLPE